MKNYHLWNPCTDVEDIAEMVDIGPICIAGGKGVYVYNRQGKRYLNAGGSLWNVAVGHGRQELCDAASEQMRILAYASCHEQTNDPAMKLAEKLCSMSGNYYDMAYFASNGADAVETAIKTSRQYFRQHSDKTFHDKYKIISFEGCYHGASYGAISTSTDPVDEEMYGPLLDGFLKVKPPFAYHGAYGTTEQTECEKRCLEAVRKLISDENSNTIAAFIAEPVMGCAGVIPFSDEFFVSLIRLLHENHILFIADEVTTGFGRTGRMFVSEAWEERPDMMCLSKGLISGYLPLSAMLATEKVFRNFRGKGKRLEHGYTASGHPVCCAVALKNIEIIEQEELCRNSAEVGEYLFNKLSELKSIRPAIGDLRGRGLMIGIELVDPDDKTPLKADDTFKIMMDTAMLGVLMYYDKNILGLFPPLILTKEQADEIVAVLEKTLDISKSGLRKRRMRMMKILSERMLRQKEGK